MGDLDMRILLDSGERREVAVPNSLPILEQRLRHRNIGFFSTDWTIWMDGIWGLQ
jgi:hypothetical protein